ncbi:MAG: GNAT family N-acetyltransferase [Acidobacteriaceae bacterium]|nr:GNAT family N-acetyltransferase [Acidobacteriaceae bacterium]
MVKIIARDPLDSGADAKLEAASGNSVAACCSLWWTHTPALAGESIGFIGHYSAIDADASLRLLEHACQLLMEKRCTRAIGPMDGSTWKKYRFITERGNRSPFFLEPDNPPEYPTYFATAGFEPLATYTSAITGSLDLEDSRATRVQSRMEREGFRIRSLNVGQFEEELHVLYQASIAAFTNNFLYQPISEEEFRSLYRPIKKHIRPELVLFAERDRDPAAFLFAIPDHDPENFIIKTLAANPRYAGRGLGTVLIHHANRAAAALGYRRAIHALMHEENQSTRISARQAQVFRRYTLFAKTLAGAKAG